MYRLLQDFYSLITFIIGTKKCNGVILSNGEKIQSKSVVITTGTFLRGSINIGNTVKPAGRLGDKPAVGLAKTLESLKFRLSRLKTGKI